MKNPITTLHIQNFKTIKDLKVNCKRINIIIGKPNVGKSNFLEALSLLGASYTDADKFMGKFIRYSRFEDLFYDKETEDNPILVDTNIGTVSMVFHPHSDNFTFLMAPSLKAIQEIRLKYQYLSDIRRELYDKQSNFDLNSPIMPYELIPYINQTGAGVQHDQLRWNSPVKKYSFTGDKYNYSRFTHYLSVPSGGNLYTIVNRSKSLKKEISDFFKEYNLEFVLRPSNTTFELQKNISGTVYSNEYEMIADTMQRMIYNLAAIESNKESILLFEEPEAHSFPPYVKLFAEKVIEAKTNQFFITTHSPFILNTIIENTKLNEVGIFIASYDKFQTKLTELTEKQIREMLDYGNDIFFSPQVLA